MCFNFEEIIWGILVKLCFGVSRFCGVDLNSVGTYTSQVRPFKFFASGYYISKLLCNQYDLSNIANEVLEIKLNLRGGVVLYRCPPNFPKVNFILIVNDGINLIQTSISTLTNQNPHLDTFASEFVPKFSKATEVMYNKKFGSFDLSLEILKYIFISPDAIEHPQIDYKKIELIYQVNSAIWNILR